MDVEKKDLRIHRPAAVVPIILDRFQRDSLRKIVEEESRNLKDLINEAINEYLISKFFIKCQFCSYEWKINNMLDMHNPNLECPECKSLQLWCDSPEKVIEETAYCNQPHFK